MPGIVRLFVWGLASDSAADGRDIRLYPIQQRDVVVFGAVPGTRWTGYAAFLKSLANEYNTSVIQFFNAATEDKATRPPDLELPSLLSSLSDSFTFPVDGTLSLIVVARLSAPPQSPSDGQSALPAAQM